MENYDTILEGLMDKVSADSAYKMAYAAAKAQVAGGSRGAEKHDRGRCDRGGKRECNFLRGLSESGMDAEVYQSIKSGNTEGVSEEVLAAVAAVDAAIDAQMDSGRDSGKDCFRNG